MWNGYKPTKKERQAIENAYRGIVESAARSHEIVDCMRNERKGYGFKSDAIPTIGAKALCVKWFYEGLCKPDILAREIYQLRPAAAWLIAHGASCALNRRMGFDHAVFQTALAAHEAAFDRMVNPKEKVAS